MVVFIIFFAVILLLHLRPYTTQTLCPILLVCYHHVYPVACGRTFYQKTEVFRLM